MGASSQSAPYLIQSLIKNSDNEISGTFHSNKFNAERYGKLFQYSIPLYGCNISNYNDIRYVLSQVKPDKICFLAGETSTSRSEQNPDAAYFSNVVSLQLWMDIIHRCYPDTEFYNFSSIRIFEGINDIADESSVGTPKSVYASTKKLGHQCVDMYRSMYNLKCTNLIIDQNDSVFKGAGFVVPKVMLYLKDIVNGVGRYPLQMGNLFAVRNFGLTSEFMECASQIINKSDYHTNYIISNCVYRNICELITASLTTLNIPYILETSIYGTRFLLSENKQPIIESYDRFNNLKRKNDEAIIVSNKYLQSNYNYPFTINFHDIINNLVNNYIGVSYVATSD